MSASSVAGRAPFFGVGYVRIDKLEELAAEAQGWKERGQYLSKCIDEQSAEEDRLKAALAEKDKEIAALRAPFESCPDSAGSGYSNHPDSGQVCYRCDGQGSYAHPGILRELITDLLSHLNPSDPETLPLIRRAMEALR